MICNNFNSGLLLLAILAFTSCNKDGVGNEEIIELSQSHCIVWVGKEYDVDLISGGHVSLESEDEAIATATLVENKIHIVPHKAGSVFINIFNNFDKKKLEITSWDLPGQWVEKVNYTIGTGEHFVFMDLADKSVEQEIQDMLIRKISLRYMSFYTFKASGEVLVDVRTSGGGVHLGTYEWNASSLTLNYNGINEYYDVELRYDGHYLLLKSDVTKEIADLYPSAGIKSVILTRYLAYYGSGY